MLVSVRADGEKIKIRFDNVTKKVKERVDVASMRSIEVIRDHLKNSILAGGMLNDTTGHLRSKRNTSLKPGALRAAVRVREVKRKDGRNLLLYFHGDDQLQFVVKKLTEGVKHPWIILAGMREGKVTRKRDRRSMLSFYLHKGMFKGTRIMQKATIHPGLKPHPVIQKAISDKIDYVRGVFRREMAKGLR